MEFCTCIPWREASREKYGHFAQIAVAEHTRLLANYTTGDGPCHEVQFGETQSVMLQQWPEEYKPKGKSTAKKIWMKPNRDMVRVQYTTAAGPGHGIFTATFSVDKKTGKHEVARLDRMDAMTKKCGITDKIKEQLCICR